ncbi:MAG: hypothetical protein KAR83_06855 [Thermodesulfovibrionales bacterium]|nr:hypothetical protein [Thermodesulfovibrionales bacterium]
MKKAFTIFIGFVHDFAAGIWLATVLAVYWLHRVDDAALAPVLKPLMKEFFYIGIGCIVMVFLAGAGRTFVYAYIGDVYGADAERLRRKMLMIKHIALLLIFGLGTYWQYVMVFG